MRQHIIEILSFLFDKASTQQFPLPSNKEAAITKLTQAGFDRKVIYQAFEWLANLVRQQHLFPGRFAHDQTLRIYSPLEIAKISTEVRSFIFSLEQEKILTTKTREIVLSQLMQLNQSQIELVDAKWVILLVLLSQPNKKSAEELRKFLLETTTKKITS